MAAERRDSSTAAPGPAGKARATLSEPTPSEDGEAASAPAEPPPLLAFRYRIGALLGRGGFGRVFEAADERLHRTVAIKLVRITGAPASRLQRFRQEARAAGGLSDPNVVAVHDAGEDGGWAFLVTERLEGHTLRAALAATSSARRWPTTSSPRRPRPPISRSAIARAPRGWPSSSTWATPSRPCGRPSRATPRSNSTP